MSSSGLTSLMRLDAPAGYLAAFAGTTLAAGATWSYVFVVPYLSTNAPALADESSGSVLAGFVLSYLLMGAGWVFFAVALWRAAVFPRWMVGLLAAGALLAVVPMPSRTLLLAVAVAALGHRARREIPAAAAPR